MSLQAETHDFEPPQLRPGETLVVASHNEGKVAELRAMLEPFGLKLHSAAELDLPEPTEVGSTFEENASLKAFFAAIATGLPALADDSGLAVDALGGKPGIHSARWAGEERDFDHAMQLVEEQLKSTGATTPDERHAQFVAVLCLAWPDGRRRSWRGTVDGSLVWPPRGDAGFGYDPMFLPDGEERTFGEMSSEEKHGPENGLSHRARAFSAFADDMLRGAEPG